MDSSLLATKLRIPRLPPHTVHRARLVDALEQAIPGYKLILLSAPAGYGKTTLLTQWAYTSQFPVVWLSLEEADNDLERFLRYLLAGWQEIQPDVAESPLGLLLGALKPDTEAVLPAFVNLASELTDRLAFLLDDYHLIDDPAIHQALTFLLDHAPPQMHFVLACRAQPPLPVARYRARQELLEFRAADLQFLAGEAEEFLNEMMRLALTDEQVTRLQGQLEGWIAGLQLAALGLRHRREIAGKLAISGRQRFIADYLREDVLAPLPANVRRFLLQTSILDRFCGPLCDAVTGQRNGQEMLYVLERENLFLVPLDDGREWYRYHRLFADFLRQELNRRHPDDLPRLHRRAARWYLAHELPEQAFDHAVVGEDVESIIEIFDNYFPYKVMRGEIKVVNHWVESLPPQWYEAYPALGLGRVFLLAISGAFEECLRTIDEVEEKLAGVETEDAAYQQARVTALRCFIACFANDLQQAEALAERALRALPLEDVHYRPGIYGALGDTYRRNGLWQEARASYLKALEPSPSPANRFQRAHRFGALADLDLRQGRLRGAADYWQKAIAAVQSPDSRGSLPLPVVGWLYIRLAEILYEWNELEQARDQLSSGLKRAELGGDVRTLIAGYLIAGRIELTRGDVEAAAEYLEQARPLVGQAAFAEWTSRFERLQLELWLAQDRLRAAADWSDQMLRDAVMAERPDSQVAQLAMARVLIVKGDAPSLKRALALLRGLLHAAEAEGHQGLLVEALALQALAHW
jgi:LuxR family transcriptional regulator, maltose regulon positive regulatory protein